MREQGRQEQGEAGKDTESRLQEALALHRAGKVDEARNRYASILERHPEHPEALHLFGLTAYQMGNLAEAAGYLDAALRVQPGNAKYLSNRGNVAKTAGDAVAAQGFYEQAAAADPTFTDAHFNLGLLLAETGRLAEAATVYDQLLATHPDNAGAANNLAMIRLRQGRPQEAAALLTGIAEAGRATAESLVNLGSIHQDLGHKAEAEAAFRAALELNPHLAGAWFNLGNLMEQQRRTADAISALERAGRLPEAQAALRHQYRFACAWPQLERLNAEIDDDARRAEGDGRTAESPFVNVTRCDDPARNLAVARSWAAVIAGRHPPLFDHTARRRNAADRPLVLGYLSSDICDHATAHLMRSLFAAHDRDRFRVNLYSYGPDDGSDYRKRIIADCDGFADVADLGFDAAARRIQADGVDVLIDLKGWTQDNRLGICAHRPAPVQVTYLGFPGTTGASFLDYVVADRIVAPPEEAGFFTEALAYMPACYQVNDDTQEIAPDATTRADWSLPQDGTVFCGFNQTYKITPQVFAAWMAILCAVPGSVLWLLGGNALAMENLRVAAVGQGIAADRLVFARRAPKPLHLRRLQLADLALDTWTCNGHTTTSDALWAGVPVIARAGRHFASRVSASCLKAVDLPELVTDSPQAYRDLAIRLATDPNARAALRSQLWNNRTRTPLFDTAGFVRALEDLYAAMWDRFVRGLPPAQIG